MKGWKQINIGSLGEVVTGNTPLTSDREFYGGTHPFIKPTDMDVDRRRVTSWEENFSEKAFKKYKNSYIPAGSTGVVTIGTVGEKLFQADRNCFTNQSVNVVIPNSEYYDEDFVYYLLKYNLPKVSAANPGTASGRHHVSKSNFCAITISVPKEKSVQTKIGTILSGFDNLIENNLKRIKLLEEITQRTYEEWFVKFRIYEDELAIDEETGLPVGWKHGKVEDLFLLQRGFDLPSHNREIGEYPIIASNGVASFHKEYKVKGPGVVTGRSGTIGKVFFTNEDFWPLNTALWVKQYFNCGPRYVYHFLKNFSLENLKAGSAVPSLDRKVVHAHNCNIPPVEVISSFEKMITPIFESIYKLEKQNNFLKEARDILLPRLMSGEIDVEEMELAIVTTK